jgi:hypothetical protein
VFEKEEYESLMNTENRTKQNKSNLRGRNSMSLMSTNTLRDGLV